MRVPDWKELNKTVVADYGLAITTHKAQGSQWENVCIVDESYCFRQDWHKWAYTAITRASEKILLIKN